MPFLDLNDLPIDVKQRTTRHSLSSGQLLMQQGDPAEQLYLLKSGLLRLVGFVGDQTVTHYFVDKGELFAESVLYFDAYACTAIAEVPSEVIAIPKEDFAAALRKSPTLTERYLANLTHRFRSVKALLELRSISSARSRLLCYLMQRRPIGGTTITLDKPLRSVASELAMAPESLSRLLSRLESEGIISRKRRRISLSEDWVRELEDSP